jgi:RNA polymerase sigma-70 factor (ECF subfamily)
LLKAAAAAFNVSALKKPLVSGIVPVVKPVELGAIESLYRSRLAVFRRVARGILGDPEAARDAVQEAFAQAVRQRAAYRGEGSLEGWVWRTVVNTARMQRRAREARPLGALPESYELETNGRPSGADPRVRAAVAALPERQRLVLFLRYYADLDYATIAEVLDISPGTVAATLNSARSSLRLHLAEVRR